MADSGMSRGLSPLKAHRIFPASPTNNSPSAPSVRPGANSSGRGGFNPPSYQVKSTGGLSPRAGNRYRTMDAAG